MVWACFRRSSREWKDQSTVGHKYPVWQSDRGKAAWPNSYWQERTKENNYWYCCTSWWNSRGKRKSGKVPGFENKIRRLLKLRNVEIDPVVIGALGSASSEFDRWMRKLGITSNVGVMQKSALLGTARILRKALQM